jgi:hypothetical protein
MGLGLLWFTRFPADSEPWILGAGGSVLPPGSYFVDLLPALLVFGAGLMVMVAPLTTALMTSVPKQRAGVASAINNAVSRVGSPLITAVIFVVVVSSFYAAVADRVPRADVDSPSFRQQVAPLNPPEGAEADMAGAVRGASTDAFHLAMLVAAGLMFAGATINAVGIRNPRREEAAEAEPARAEAEPSPAEEHALAAAPVCVICEEPLEAGHGH